MQANSPPPPGERHPDQERPARGPEGGRRARRAAKEFAEKQNAEATARAADTLAKAQQAIELEHKENAQRGPRRDRRLVVKTTEQVLAKKLSEADRTAYNEAASKNFPSVDIIPCAATKRPRPSRSSSSS